MATVTNLGGLQITTDAATYSVGPFTPAANTLIVVFAMLTGETSTDWTVTDDHAGTYTKIRRQVKNASADIMEVWIANQRASAVATNWTYSHASGNATGSFMQIYSVSGMSRTGSAAVRSQGGQDNQAAAGTPAPALNQAALNGNPTITVIHNATNPPGTTAPSGWAVGAARGYNVPVTGSHSTFRNSGFTGTTITWGSTSVSAFSSVAIELLVGKPENQLSGGVFTTKKSKYHSGGVDIEKPVKYRSGGAFS